MPAEFLFVYGTLRQSSIKGGHNQHPMHLALKATSEYLCEGHCQGRLYDIGDYPGLKLDPSGKDRVRGEIYRLNNPHKLWHILDDYENFKPLDPTNSDYIRKKTPVTTSSHGNIVSWVYHYNRAIDHCPQIISGDYCLPRGATII